MFGNIVQMYHHDRAMFSKMAELAIGLAIGVRRCHSLSWTTCHQTYHLRNREALPVNIFSIMSDKIEDFSLIDCNFSPFDSLLTLWRLARDRRFFAEMVAMDILSNLLHIPQLEVYWYMNNRKPRYMQLKRLLA